MGFEDFIGAPVRQIPVLARRSLRTVSCGLGAVLASSRHRRGLVQTFSCLQGFISVAIFILKRNLQHQQQICQKFSSEQIAVAEIKITS